MNGEEFPVSTLIVPWTVASTICLRISRSFCSQRDVFSRNSCCCLSNSAIRLSRVARSRAKAWATISAISVVVADGRVSGVESLFSSLLSSNPSLSFPFESPVVSAEHRIWLCS